jgi:hypothetical protein
VFEVKVLGVEPPKASIVPAAPPTSGDAPTAAEPPKPAPQKTN